MYVKRAGNETGFAIHMQPQQIATADKGLEKPLLHPTYTYDVICIVRLYICTYLLYYVF
jgi:hypothetical protein